MADQKQLRILKQGVEAWNQWREAQPHVQVNLSGAELINANLRNANLSNANLSEADLSQASLNKANLSQADLSQADLNRAHLRGANLSGATLVATIFGQANLSAANLSQANLWEADLRRADLSFANLRNANLGKADLRSADVNGTDLQETNLVGTNLAGAKLLKANLTGSQMGSTTFANNDLSEILGLGTIRHYNPSTIGFETVRNSKGIVPVEFLRGCGLSDVEIESAKLAAPGLDSEQVTQITYEIYRLYADRPIQFYSCFISYNSADHKFAKRLHDDLQNKGVRCWFAPEDLKIGDEFRHTIGREIRLRDKLLIVLSESSIRSEWVGDEVEKALAEEKEQGTLKLFPIRLDNAIFEAKDDWAEKIRLRRHIGDFSDNYGTSFERLVRDLKT